MPSIPRTLDKTSFSITGLILAGLLLLPVAGEAAEKTTKKPVAKQVTAVKPAKQTTKAKKPRGAAQAKAPVKFDEDTARTTFETFAREWMAKLAEAEEFQRAKKIKVTETPDGYSAEYIGYLPERSIQVRKTESTDTPFVGTLTYYERTLRCTGKTKEQAIQGPFEQVGTSPVLEIFRFTKGKWVY
ncbi:MAG: hypothetical protein FJ147_10670 [Deltaproteobacteria bacterium]|nr:hypothetical protein [Deltaproteobacteria bacterium]